MNAAATITINKKIKIHDPILIVGLPGIGSVGRLVAVHLIKEYKAVKFATLYSSDFPFEVKMLKNGTVRRINNRFYLIKREKEKNDVVVLTGDVQALTSEGQHQVNTKIVDYFVNGLGGKFIYTLGGYISAGGYNTSPKVFGSASTKEVIAQFKNSGVIFGEAKGTIWGSAGLIVAFAKSAGIGAVCLMGESSMMNVDAAAAKAVINVLAKRLGLTVDMTHFDTMIEKTAKAIKEMEAQVQAGGGFPIGPGGNEKPSYIR